MMGGGGTLMVDRLYYKPQRDNVDAAINDLIIKESIHNALCSR